MKLRVEVMRLLSNPEHPAQRFISPGTVQYADGDGR